MSESDSILTRILADKRREVDAERAKKDEAKLREEALSSARPRGFVSALKRRAQHAPAIIAEIKRASPSRGPIRPDLDVLQTALDYAAAGATAISVLTDSIYFDGRNDFLPAIRSVAPELPILRKEFIIDTFQVWQTRALGADALLLIVAALSEESLTQLLEEAQAAELDVLVEVHDETELFIAVQAFEKLCKKWPDANVILGINNRDLKTFALDKTTTPRLVAKLHLLAESSSQKSLTQRLLVVSESAIRNATDLAELWRAGARAFLIGEALLEKGQPGQNLRQLIADVKQLLPLA